MNPADHLVPAVCHRCGGAKKAPLVPCKECGFTPTGPERALAWLFSEHHLDAGELEEAARRVRTGERPDPSRALQADARAAMGAAPLTDRGARPLPPRTLLLVGLGNLLLTPLAGYAIWFGLREPRPVAARQALSVTIPVSTALALAWLAMVLGPRL